MTRFRIALCLSVLSIPMFVAAQGPPPIKPLAAPKTPVERGAYLVNAGGCHDCHTPWKMTPHGPEPDMTKMLSGHPATVVMGALPAMQGGWAFAFGATFTSMAGPWGVSYAHNLTPDPKTGLPSKGWTEERFIRALRTGQHLGGGRPILPPMPWPNYGRMTDDDLKAIYAYLQTIPPVENAVPEPVIAPPPPAK